VGAVVGNKVVSDADGVEVQTRFASKLHPVLAAQSCSTSFLVQSRAPTLLQASSASLKVSPVKHCPLGLDDENRSPLALHPFSCIILNVGIEVSAQHRTPNLVLGPTNPGTSPPQDCLLPLPQAE